MHINILELFAVYVAVRAWGQEWRNRHILIHSDNESVVQVATSGSCRDVHMMRLSRALFFLTARLNVRLSFQHLPGIDNAHADLLSRLQAHRFRELCPAADQEQTQIPPEVWLALEKGDAGY